MRKKGSLLDMINITVIGIVSATVLMLSAVFSFYLYNNINQSSMNNLNMDLSQINQQLTKSIEDAFNAANQLASDVQLGYGVEKYYSDNVADTVEGKKMIDYILQNAMAMNSEVENITIIAGNRVIQNNRYGKVNNNMSQVMSLEWYKKLLEEEVPFVFTSDLWYGNKTDESKYFLCATKFKNKFYENRKDENRIVIVTFKLDELEKLMINTARMKNINMMLYNQNDSSIIYNVSVSKLYNQMADDFGKVGDSISDRLKKRFIVLHTTNQLTNWEVSGFIEKSVYMREIYPIQAWFLGVAAIVLGISILMSILIFRRISKPLKNVMQAMERLGRQGFYALDESNKYIEIDHLITTFNSMSLRISELISGIEQKEKEKRREEYRALEYQINPHFIYNTLDAIRWVALMNNSKPTAQIISSFGKFLRISLSEGKEMITVEKEIQLTEEYANIMLFRNNFAIDIQYDMPEDIKNLYTLKLVLQPLVENCFIHAFDKSSSKGRIIIKCFTEKDRLIIEVEDNGRGIAKEEISHIDNRLFSRLGIHNIDERIKLWHGSEYGLRISPAETGGTRVTLSQPLIREPKEECHDIGNVD